jgi:hypothetical protein
VVGVGAAGASPDEGDAPYRLHALCAALGTLCAEAFPMDVAAAAAGAEGAAHAVVVPAFSWRRRAGADAASRKRRRDDDGDDVPPPHTLLTAADVGTHFAGCALFSVSGAVVPAFALAMARASPVLSEALDTSSSDASGGAAARPIPLPPLAGMSAAQQHAAFLAAVEHAYTGDVAALRDSGGDDADAAASSVADAEADATALLQPLWRVAHALRMEALQAWVAPRLLRALRTCAEPVAALCGGFELSQSYHCATLESACARALLAHLGALAACSAASAGAEARRRREQQRERLAAAGAALAALAETRAHALRAALAAALTDALAALFGPSPAAAAGGA